MELAISHEDSEILLRDKNVLQEAVVNKYRMAGQIAQTALKFLTNLINNIYHYKTVAQPLTISELCLLTDSFIINTLEQHYKHKVNERGIATPTTIEVDQVNENWAPELDDVDNLYKWNNNGMSPDAPYSSSVTGFLKTGDVVKLSLGVYIDGYTANVSHTMVIYPVTQSETVSDQSTTGANVVPTGPLLGVKADAVAATHIAMETVVALLGCALTPEKLPSSLGTVVNGQLIRLVVDSIAQSYNCCVVPGSKVRRIRRFLAGQNEGVVAERDYKGVVWTEADQETALFESSEAKDMAVVASSNDSGNTATGELALNIRDSSAIPTDDFTVKAGEVYTIDLRLAPVGQFTKKGLVTLETVDSYTGKSSKSDTLAARSGIFLRDFTQTHILKLRTSKQLLNKIDRHGVYPFKLAHLSSGFPLDTKNDGMSTTDYSAQLDVIKQDLKSFRLGMSEISNNYLCSERPITVAKWVPWEYILSASNESGNLSYDATQPLTLPGHELPLPRLGVSSLKLKTLINNCNESQDVVVTRECNTVVLCDSNVGTNGRPELLRLTGGPRTCAPSWVHSEYELNGNNNVIQGVIQLATLAKDKRFGILIRETHPMKQSS